MPEGAWPQKQEGTEFEFFFCLFQSDLEQYKKVLLDAGCDLSPLNYIKQWK